MLPRRDAGDRLAPVSAAAADTGATSTATNADALYTRQKHLKKKTKTCCIVRAESVHSQPLFTLADI